MNDPQCKSRDPRDGRRCELYVGHSGMHFRIGAAGGWSFHPEKVCTAQFPCVDPGSVECSCK